MPFHPPRRPGRAAARVRPVLHRLRHFLVRRLFPPLPRGEVAKPFMAYLREAAGPALGLDASRLAPPPAQGKNTLVLRWETPQRGALFARAWRYDRMQRPALDHKTSGELLRAAGRRVPELVWFDDGWPTLRRWRLECAIETAAPGQPLSELIHDGSRSPEPCLVEAIAAEAAALHAWRPAVPPAWGKPWAPLNPLATPEAYWRRRLRALAEEMPPGLLRLAPDRLRAGIARLEAALPGLDWGGPPALIHGDLAPWHLFMRRAPGAAPDFTWIDFGTVHWGHPALDIAALRGWFDLPCLELFARAYRRAGGPERAIAPEAVEWFRRARQLEKLATRIAKRRSPRHQARGDQGFREQEQDRLESYVERWL